MKNVLKVIEETISFRFEMKMKSYSSVYNYACISTGIYVEVGSSRWSVIKNEFQGTSGTGRWL